jgi:hypothetical protein
MALDPVLVNPISIGTIGVQDNENLCGCSKGYSRSGESAEANPDPRNTIRWLHCSAAFLPPLTNRIILAFPLSANEPHSHPKLVDLSSVPNIWLALGPRPVPSGGHGLTGINDEKQCPPPTSPMYITFCPSLRSVFDLLPDLLRRSLRKESNSWISCYRNCIIVL